MVIHWDNLLPEFLIIPIQETAHETLVQLIRRDRILEYAHVDVLHRSPYFTLDENTNTITVNDKYKTDKYQFIYNEDYIIVSASLITTSPASF